MVSRAVVSIRGPAKRHTSCTNLKVLLNNKNQLEALISQIYFGMKLYMFRTIPLSIIRSFSLYMQQWYMSYRFADSFRAGSGWNSLILLESCQETCMTYTSAVCTVKNSWWWTEELSETCRVFFYLLGKDYNPCSPNGIPQGIYSIMYSLQEFNCTVYSYIVLVIF